MVGRPITIEKITLDDQDGRLTTGLPLLREGDICKAPQRLDKGVSQMYDSFCEACGYRLGDVVKITASAASTIPDAEDIVFADVTDAAVPRLPTGEIYPWEFFLASRPARGDLPMHLHPGMAFKDIVLDGPPRTFTVSTVNGSNHQQRPLCS